LALKKISRIVVDAHGGKLPHNPATLETFPGIGHATARSILAFAFNSAEPFIETNIRRVYIHHFFPRRKNVEDTALLPIVAATLDKKNPREWYWALMDYGSHLRKTLPNPNRRSARYRPQSEFKGSRRELRGKILKILLAHTSISVKNCPYR
jgi:A/G-specific adenine glycosylase